MGDRDLVQGEGVFAVAVASMGDADYRRNLGDGLVLRWSCSEDVERIFHLYRLVFRDGPEQPLNRHVHVWVGDLMGGRHPLIGPGDFALVEDTVSGAIVAASCLMAQMWEYDGVPLSIGRPEIVASHPDYRRRGLVRAVFELIHARSLALGHEVQGITGIPYYYRQFGYEYALELGGGRTIAFSAIPLRKPDEPELYRLRAATVADMPQIRQLYDRERSRSYNGAAVLVSTVIDVVYWQFLLEAIDPESLEGWRTTLIVDAVGQVLGYVLVRRGRWHAAISVVGCSVMPGVSLVAVLPSVLRGLQELAPQIPTYKSDAPAPSAITFELGSDHPVYALLGAERMIVIPPYSWYVRVADVPGLMRRIAPVLEQRLAGSMLSGHGGELRIDFYRDGLRLVFEAGRLMVSEVWHPPIWGPKAQCGFPPLVFLQLVFGYRGLDGLCFAFPDVRFDDDVRLLLDVLFPPRLSWVLPLD